ncbi:MAG: DUF192 domain-containing protein [Actinobacteria bacterium]|nr:DUF192 domain-containing protein [Actinomycetota bacterium]
MSMAAGVLVVVGVVLLVVALVRARSHATPLARPIAAALDAARPAVAPFDGWDESRVGVGPRCLRLVLARTPRERRAGLMGRRDLGPYDGMLFVSPRDTGASFTMYRTDLALDLGLYDRSGTPRGRAELVPCPAASITKCPQTVPARPYRLAIETPRGSLPQGALGACGPG